MGYGRSDLSDGFFVARCDITRLIEASASLGEIAPLGFSGPIQWPPSVWSRRYEGSKPWSLTVIKSVTVAGCPVRINVRSVGRY